RPRGRTSRSPCRPRCRRRPGPRRREPRRRPARGGGGPPARPCAGSSSRAPLRYAPHAVVLFLLIDGVGIGARDPGINPLARHPTLLSHFADGSGVPLPRGGRVRAADATLGVPGRPQSATGHTTLLTGVNAARHLGRHLLGFPNEALRRLLARRNLFLDLAHWGRRAAFANAYRAAYLEALDLPHQPPALEEPPLPVPVRANRPAASTVAFRTLGEPFRTFDHLRRGEALYHDVTSEQ